MRPLSTSMTPTAATITDSFLGNVVEICIVTRDVYRTMAGLYTLGIGPWRVYTFSPENTTNQTYHGAPSPFTLRVCFAQIGNITWELMQPVCGNTIFAEFLDTHNEGIQHVAFDCNNIPWEDRLREFERRGYKCVQGGSWMDKNHFAFFETQEATTTTFETYSFPEDWEYPVPEETYPPRHIFSEI